MQRDDVGEWMEGLEHKSVMGSMQSEVGNDMPILLL